ncbi:hypothetical protein OFM88_30880, partial [Escherichia coli]|nr:hypothetical protein [Escherichia coli]
KVYSRKNSRSNDYVTKAVAPETILRFINSFLSFSKFYTDLPIDPYYIQILENERTKIKSSTSNRDLPPPKDILVFKDCIEYFFI